jgi:hypothetical protein
VANRDRIVAVWGGVSISTGQHLARLDHDPAMAVAPPSARPTHAAHQPICRDSGEPLIYRHHAVGTPDTREVAINVHRITWLAQGWTITTEPTVGLDRQVTGVVVTKAFGSWTAHLTASSLRKVCRSWGGSPGSHCRRT